MAYPDLVFERFDADRVAGLDLVFLGLPHEASMALAPSLHGKVGCLVDLSAAFRLKDASPVPDGGTASSTTSPSCWPTRCTGCPSSTGPSSRARG